MAAAAAPAVPLWHFYRDRGPASDSCVFSVDLLVPAGASDGAYTSTSSTVTGTLSGTSVTLTTMRDTLTVQRAALSLVKSYATTATAPGDTVTAQYTLTNLSSTHAIDSIIFSDDLDAQLSGLTPMPAPCRISVAQALPSAAARPSALAAALWRRGRAAVLMSPNWFQVAPALRLYRHPRHAQRSKLCLAVGGSATPANLTVSSFSLPSFSKSFADTALAAGGSTTLTYVITNTDPSATLSGLRFSDDLGAALSGLVVTAGTGSDICGSGSSVSGSGTVTFEAGSWHQAPAAVSH